MLVMKQLNPVKCYFRTLKVLKNRMSGLLKNDFCL